MNIRFHTRPETRATHQPVTQRTDLSPLPEPTLHARRSIKGPLVACAISAALTAAACAGYYSEQLDLRDGYDLKGGLMHIDPTGIRWFDDRINGARGTRGLSR